MIAVNEIGPVSALCFGQKRLDFADQNKFIGLSLQPGDLLIV